MDNDYQNRELSWLDFNERIIWEARNPANPLMERCKFLAIAANNLDEFMMVRFAYIKKMMLKGSLKVDSAGYDYPTQYDLILARVNKLISFMQETFQDEIIPALYEKKLYFTPINTLNEKQLEKIDSYFENKVEPLLNMSIIDETSPMPSLKNKALNMVVLLKKAEVYKYAIIEIPEALERYIKLDKMIFNERCFVFIEDLLIEKLDELFLDYEVVDYACFKILRDASFQVSKSKEIISEVKKMIKKRKTSSPVYLEVPDTISDTLLDFLKKELHVLDQEIFTYSTPLDYTFLFQFYEEEESLQFIKNEPVINVGEDMFEKIRKQDVFMHLPYDSFQAVVDFLNQAASHPQVVQIKQTLYRVSEQSPIVEALERAALNGKQVSVLVELKARFDEVNNLKCARRLEKAGCHVIYGLPGLKTHSKITLVVALEKQGVRRYVHLGTGNYNDKTASVYTDLGIFTCQKDIGEDAAKFFKMLFLKTEKPELKYLSVDLRNKLTFLIDREIKQAKLGKKAQMILKMNSLIDQPMMDKLYEASRAGVQVDLIVRGICGLKIINENIRVRSIIGRYLEHSRIFYFYNDGNEEVYLASADFMPRNFDKRIELMYFVLDERIKRQVIKILFCELRDNVRAWLLAKDGSYQRVEDEKEPFDSQAYFMNRLNEN